MLKIDQRLNYYRHLTNMNEAVIAKYQGKVDGNGACTTADWTVGT